MIKLLFILLSLNTATIKVTGLTCSMCSFSVQKGLEKVSSIKEIKPNLEETSFEITFKDDIFVNFNEVENAVLDAGFFLDKKSIKVDLKNDSNFKSWKNEK